MGWWFKRRLDVEGTVLFSGSLPPRPESFARLEREGVGIQPVEGRPGARWSLRLTHPSWGEADVVLPVALPPTPTATLEFDPRLSATEKRAIAAAGCGLRVDYKATKEDLLRDRKLALRFMACVMGADGVAAVDHLAHRFWSPAELQQELAHDADLDIEALMTIHNVTDGGRHYWLHSHGLREAGLFDFSILDPGDVARGQGFDVLRALAFAIAEQRLALDGGPFPLVGDPPVAVRAMSVTEFAPRSDPRLHSAWRKDLEADTSRDHIDGHGVICDGRIPGSLARWLRRDRPKASGLLSGGLPENLIIPFSKEATSLMAARAVQTYSLLRSLAGELADLEVKPIVKLGYVVDGGDSEEREHLWFEVGAFGDDWVDATLINEPYGIARMKAGDRSEHPAALLSDWIILTPVGAVTPRDLSAARVARERRAEIIEKLHAAAQGPM